ncbi:MAG: nucleotidyltransferase family protein [Salinivenus sp.]
MSPASSTTIKETLRRHLLELREEYGVESFALFGSYVRGEQQPDSDIDILVTFDDPPGLLAFIELEHTLSDLLGQSVDLVTENALKPRIGDRVRQEAEPI